MIYMCFSYDDSSGEWTNEPVEVEVNGAINKQTAIKLANAYSVASGNDPSEDDVKIEKICEILPGHVIISGFFGRDMPFIQHCIES